MDFDESSESTGGVRQRVTARLVALNLAAMPCGTAALAGGGGATAATSLRSAVVREIPGTLVHSSAGTPEGLAMSTPPAASVRVNASGGTLSPGASVESSPHIFEEDGPDLPLEPPGTTTIVRSLYNRIEISTR